LNRLRLEFDGLELIDEAACGEDRICRAMLEIGIVGIDLDWIEQVGGGAAGSQPAQIVLERLNGGYRGEPRSEVVPCVLQEFESA
jgi:hypothetical protein